MEGREREKEKDEGKEVRKERGQQLPASQFKAYTDVQLITANSGTQTPPTSHSN